MRILVTGSRDWRTAARIRAVLREITEGRPGRHTLVHGAARGADRIAAGIAAGLGWEVEPHPADWAAPCGETCQPDHRRAHTPDRPSSGFGSGYCPDAGKRRNQDMVNLGADVCVAFLAPNATNAGTRDCVRRARAAGLPIREVTP